MTQDIVGRWEELAHVLGAAQEPSARAIVRILDAYAAPSRRYHSLEHVSACLGVMDRHVPAEHLAHVTAAVFWHDYVYDATRSDNEEASARAWEEAAAEMGLGAGSPFAAEVSEMILATKHDASVAGKAARVLYLLDVDLSILGEAPEVFDAYERGVREEYAFVPEDAFRAGRATILRRFLERPHLYETQRLRAVYEEPARKNLARSLAALSRG